MADLKISQLTGATTPLAGTEVVPLVQSNTTKKVSIADLTAGRAVSMSSLGVGTSSINGAATIQNASVRVEIGEISGANYLESLNNGRTDSVGLRLYSQTLGIFTRPVAGSYSQSVDVGTTGNITFNIGNLIQGTAAKGVNFTANTPAAGMTSQLLNWYEEGTWTPTIIGSSSAGTGTYTLQEGHYTRIGRQVTVTCAITWTAHTGTGVIRVSGLPFTIKNDNVYAAFAMEYNNLTVSANAIAIIVTRPGQTYLQVDETVAGGATQTGVSMDTAASLWFSATYFA